VDGGAELFLLFENLSYYAQCETFVEGYGTKTTLDYIKMLYISYGSVCELETQILLAGDLGFIEKGELGTAKKDIAEIERILKALIKSLENKHLNP
jgi:four helix bundle protein